MSGQGSSMDQEVKVSSRGRKLRRPREFVVDTNDPLDIEAEEIKLEDSDAMNEIEGVCPNGDEDDAPQGKQQQEEDVRAPSPTTSQDGHQVEVNLDDEDDEETQDAVFGIDKDSDLEHVDETPFKIEKVYSVAKDGKPATSSVPPSLSSSITTSSVTSTSKGQEKADSKKNPKDEKPLKPKPTQGPTLALNLAKMPGLTGGVGGVRLLGGGVRGANMPLLLNMGGGNAGIPLLPAGLPPGRYVILPGTSTTTKTTCATVNTTSPRLAPRVVTKGALALGHPVVNANTVLGHQASVAAAVTSGPAVRAAVTTTVASCTTTTTSLTSLASSTIAPPAAAAGGLTPTPTLIIPGASQAAAKGSGSYVSRERGRRKSYTTVEKLAMIEAVETGQRKSTVADRFGVAPSTLSCILAQKNKIRAERDNFRRRRFRHNKYLHEDRSGRGAAEASASSRDTTAAESTTSSQSLAQSQDQPFTHFLASLTGPTPTVLDTQPEEIIAVPDLMERMEGVNTENVDVSEGGSEARGVPTDEEEEEEVEGDGVTNGGTPAGEDYHQEHRVSPRKGQGLSSIGALASRRKQKDATEGITVKQEPLERSSSPTIQGMTGPYLLKKETHCATVLDQLLRDDTFTDVTLTAEGQSLRAHRIVLCLASPYFRQVLGKEQNVQSVVLLRDVKFTELRNMIHFIYTGEATVDAADLESFLRTADMLEITSLCEGRKFISSHGLTQGDASASLGRGDFEKLIGPKRLSKESSSPSRKSRRVSAENPLGSTPTENPHGTLPSEILRTSLTENQQPRLPVGDSNSSSQMVLIVEDQNESPPSSSKAEQDGLKDSANDLEDPFKSISPSSSKVEANVEEVSLKDSVNDAEEPSKSVSDDLETSKLKRKMRGRKRKRRAVSVPLRGYAISSDDDEASSQKKTSKLPFSEPVPKRCPYCPSTDQTFEGVTMMRHLHVHHCTRPAFPCAICWRVFVKRSLFESHLQTCETLVFNQKSEVS